VGISHDLPLLRVSKPTTPQAPLTSYTEALARAAALAGSTKLWLAEPLASAAGLGWVNLFAEQGAEARRKLQEAMVPVHCRASLRCGHDDDLNTSSALAVLFDLARPLPSLARQCWSGETTH